MGLLTVQKSPLVNLILTHVYKNTIIIILCLFLFALLCSLTLLKESEKELKVPESTSQFDRAFPGCAGTNPIPALAPPRKPTEPERSAANVPVSDIAGHPQGALCPCLDGSELGSLCSLSHSWTVCMVCNNVYVVLSQQNIARLQLSVVLMLGLMMANPNPNPDGSKPPSYRYSSHTALTHLLQFHFAALWFSVYKYFQHFLQKMFHNKSLARA